MFTGLIEEVGSVLGIQTTHRGTKLEIDAPLVAAKIQLGASIAVNGCCLTVTARDDNRLTFDLLGETLDRTNLKGLRPASRVNLECAVAVGAPLGGHLMQGHVDCATHILVSEELGADQRIEVELPPEFARYVVCKGSIAVNGISLTVAEVSPRSFSVWIIPQTRARTNLDTVRAGDLVNLEFDLLAKYVERMLEHPVISRSSA